MRTLQGEIKKLEAIKGNLTAEKEILKESEKRLIEQINQLNNSKIYQQSLLDNLQSIIQIKEKNDNELKFRLNNEIELLQKEWYLFFTKKKINILVLYFVNNIWKNWKIIKKNLKI